MTFGESIKSVFTKYATFSGVASRSEYWYFYLFTQIVFQPLNFISFGLTSTTRFEGANAGAGLDTAQLLLTLFSVVVSLGMILPTLAVTARRYHDAGFSGLWMLLNLAPLFGLFLSVPILISFGINTNNIAGDFYSTGSAFGTALLTAMLQIFAAFIPAILLAIGAFVVQLVITVKPTKTRAEGNKYAPDEAYAAAATIVF